MKHVKEDLRQYIAKELISACENSKTLTLYNLLVKILNHYNLWLMEVNHINGFEIRGEDGLEIIQEMKTIIEDMSKNGYIELFEQGNTKYHFPQEGVGNFNQAIHFSGSKIDGTYAAYIRDNLMKSIRVESELYDYIDNGFKSTSETNAEDSKKTSKCSLWWTIIGVIVAIIGVVVAIIYSR